MFFFTFFLKVSSDLKIQNNFTLVQSLIHLIILCNHLTDKKPDCNNLWTARTKNWAIFFFEPPLTEMEMLLFKICLQFISSVPTLSNSCLEFKFKKAGKYYFGTRKNLEGKLTILKNFRKPDCNNLRIARTKNWVIFFSNRHSQKWKCCY